MGKFKTGLGFGIAIVGAYMLADKFYPEETKRHKEDLKQRCVAAKDEILSLKDATVHKGQDIVGVASLATDETKENFANTQKEVVQSLKSLSDKVGKVVSETKNNLTDPKDTDQVVETLAKGVKEVKDELTHSFEEILSSFNSLKEGVQQTADTTVELSEEVVAE